MAVKALVADIALTRCRIHLWVAWVAWVVLVVVTALLSAGLVVLVAAWVVIVALAEVMAVLLLNHK